MNSLEQEVVNLIEWTKVYQKVPVSYTGQKHLLPEQLEEQSHAKSLDRIRRIHMAGQLTEELMDMLNENVPTWRNVKASSLTDSV